MTPSNAKTVVHRDGTVEKFQMEQIIKAIQYAVDGVDVDDPYIAVFKILKNFELKMPDTVKTEEIDGLLLKAIEPIISEDPAYDAIATKQLVKMINKEVHKRFKTMKDYVIFGVDQWILDKRLLDFDFKVIEKEISADYDNNLNCFGTSTLKHRYLLKDFDKRTIETVQWMWMRIAMWLALAESEKDKHDFAIKLYHKLAWLKYLHSTPTLFYSGTSRSQLISCFIGVVDDDLNSIMDKAKETANYAKYGGGTGLYIGKLRASGSLIKSINSPSGWPIPFVKIWDVTVSSVAIGGKRASNMVLYMDTWHYNIDEYLDLKETNGNDFVRARKLNTALRVSDNFFKKVEADQDRYMFDPYECPELTETWGDEFESYYDKYCMMAEQGQLALWKKTKARQLYDRILMQAAKSGNFWINFKDRHNEKSQAPSYGLIHSTNMCTEISIPNRVDSTAVCTLASLNLSRFIDFSRLTKDVSRMTIDEKLWAIDWDDLGDTVKLAIRALDNVTDLNFYPSEESKKGAVDLRPLGLGVMGFGEMLIHLGIAYDSKEVLVLSDKLASFIYNHALATSESLAEERWTFLDYDPKKYSYKPRRNILLLAIAPTASISNIAGTSSGIENYFANVYSRETISGSFTVIVKELVKQLKTKDMWTDDVRRQILAGAGSIQHIEELDGVINKDLFKTVYEISPYAQVDVAAVWQKYIDQSISRNLYMTQEDRWALADIYLYAWKQWLKSTYYCFIKKDIQWEKYTQKVNKRGQRAGFRNVSSTTDAVSLTVKRWFGIAKTAEADSDQLDAINKELEGVDVHNLTDEQKSLIETKLTLEKGEAYVEKLKKGELYVNACPSDPFEKVMCEWCQ